MTRTRITEYRVTKVTGPTTYKYSIWGRYVVAECIRTGEAIETEVLFRTEQSANACTPGYRFDI